MATQMRQMIKIDEELCNGCGECVTACAEGALQIIDGKAKMISETYCDGLGACLGECPQDAISFEERVASEFDEEATVAHLKEIGRSPEAHFAHMAEHASHMTHGSHTAHMSHTSSSTHAGHVCPSARTIDRRSDACEHAPAAKGAVASELRQWPLKLYLVNPAASFFQDSELLVAADCTAFAYGAFHPDLLRGKTLVTGCPKFDDTQLYLEKLTEILRHNDVKSITVAKMEVPCCSGLVSLAEAAVEASGKHLPVETVTVSLSGELANSHAACCH